MPAIMQQLADLATGVALLTIPVFALYLVFSNRLKMSSLYWLLVVLLFSAGLLHLVQAAPWLHGTSVASIMGLVMTALSWATLITLLVVVPKLMKQRSPEELQHQIHQREQAEQRLRETIALYQSLNECLPLNVIRKDLAGAFIDCNQRFCDTLRMSREQILGKTDFDFYPESQAQKYHQDDLKVFETGESLELVEEYVGPNGERLYMQVLKAPVRDAEGRIAGVQGMFWDVTQRMRAEEQLRASDAKLRKLVQSSIMGVIVADFAGHVLEANDAFLAMLGYTREELDKGQLRWDQLTPPEFRAGDERAMATLLEHEDCPSWEKEFFHKAGHRVPVLIGVTMLSHAKQECICFALDITSQKQTERDLKLAKELADQASRAKSQFLANMSHEVRTPMNAVIGLTELVLNTPLESQQREYLQLVLQSGEGLLSVINDVLDFSKVESGHVQLDLQPTNLRECLGDALKSLAVRAHGKQLELLLDIAPDVPDWFSTDRGRLRQIVNNLVSNAIKFTYSGEVVVSVRRGTSLANPSDETVPISFCVADTGIGIAAEKQKLIFEPFEQADASTTRHFGGTGLGLTIVQRLVELLDGRITIESELGKGSKFMFTLQLEPCEALPQVAPRIGGLEGARVLVVDHHPTSRRILHDTLESWRMEPIMFDNAAQASRKLLEESNGHPACDVVVTDLRPEDGNAWSLVEQLRANPSTASLPVILLLSHESSEIAPQCQRLEVKQRLFKPIKQSELFDALAAAMNVEVSSLVEPVVAPHVEAPATVAVRSLRILLAEDSLVNQRLAVGVLERLGHEAMIANNGHEALDLLQREKFDLALMDIQMPELDGLQTALRIREQEAKTGGHLPIVAVTAHALKGDRERCLEVGMDGYVSKPIRQKQLIDEIERVLGTAIVAPVSPAASPTTTEPVSVVDWRVALEFCNGDAALLREIAEAFLEEWPKRTTEMRRAIDDSNFDLLHRCGHTIKGSLRYFGADAPFATALELENLGSKHSLEGAEAKWTRLQQQVQEAIPILVAYVQGKLQLPS
ncbi:response regulator [Anatilimnocola sp. NA78]|uniref:response regulator n=1 Tax=Anatilimnocola sp. NA78 TaxID=3415683 RepID=UPI003CE4DFB5